jgi:hypothetical protein
MPIKKLHLSRAEEARYLTALRKLRAAGLALEIPAELLEDSSAVEIIVAGGPASSVFVSSNGIVYSTLVRLVATRPCTLLDCRIGTDWDDDIVLSSFDDERPYYKLGPLHYSRGEVLNQRIENGLRFHRRGDMFEGMILANGLRPIPGKFLDGSLVPFQITLEDQFGEESTAAATLSLGRTAKPRPAIQRGTGLYGMNSASRAKVSVVSEDTRRHPRPTVPSTHDDAYSAEPLQPEAHRARTSMEI